MVWRYEACWVRFDQSNTIKRDVERSAISKWHEALSPWSCLCHSNTQSESWPLKACRERKKNTLSTSCFRQNIDIQNQSNSPKVSQNAHWYRSMNLNDSHRYAKFERPFLKFLREVGFMTWFLWFSPETHPTFPF